MTNHVRIGTVVFLFRGGLVLLGRKQGKPEMGEGTLNGPGGKMEPIDKTIRDCAARELFEEVGVTVGTTDLKKVAIITFYAAGAPNMEVHFYTTDTFSDEPRETESMIPEWHHPDRIPYERMLDSDEHWLPRLLSGEKFRTNVYYREKGKGYLRMDPFSPLDDLD